MPSTTNSSVSSVALQVKREIPGGEASTFKGAPSRASSSRAPSVEEEKKHSKEGEFLGDTKGPLRRSSIHPDLTDDRWLSNRNTGEKEERKASGKRRDRWSSTRSDRRL